MTAFLNKSLLILMLMMAVVAFATPVRAEELPPESPPDTLTEFAQPVTPLSEIDDQVPVNEASRTDKTVDKKPVAKTAPAKKTTKKKSMKEALLGTKKDAAKTETTEAKPAPEPDPEKVEKLGKDTQSELQRLTDALRQENKAINNELRDDEELALKDVAMLWQAAVERSGTIRFAIEKLSRRDATGKPVADDSFTKKILQGAARLGGVAGSIWTGTPAGILGGNMVEEMLQGDPTVSAMTRVTDADMVLLAKEVEALQSQLLDSYYKYRHAREQWEISKEAEATLTKYYDQMGKEESRSLEKQALQPLMQSLLDGARQEEVTSRQTFVSARNALALMVGGDAVVALEDLQENKPQSAAGQ